jgi:hypothetical protein
MNNNETSVRIFTGREVQGIILKAELEENGIISIIKNDFQSGLSAGFATGTAPEIDILIKAEDLLAAEPIVAEFMKNNS